MKVSARTPINVKDHCIDDASPFSINRTPISTIAQPGRIMGFQIKALKSTRPGERKMTGLLKKKFQGNFYDTYH